MAIYPKRLDMPVIPGVPLVFDANGRAMNFVFLDKNKVQIGTPERRWFQHTYLSFPIPPPNAKYMRWTLDEEWMYDNYYFTFSKKVYFGLKNKFEFVAPSDIVISSLQTYSLNQIQCVGIMPEMGILKSTIRRNPSISWENNHIIAELQFHSFGNASLNITNHTPVTYTITAGTVITFNVPYRDII